MVSNRLFAATSAERHLWAGKPQSHRRIGFFICFVFYFCSLFCYFVSSRVLSVWFLIYTFLFFSLHLLFRMLYPDIWSCLFIISVDSFSIAFKLSFYFIFFCFFPSSCISTSVLARNVQENPMILYLRIFSSFFNSVSNRSCRNLAIYKSTERKKKKKIK